jgi:lipopolysaccharide transport system permease protein
MWRHYFDLALYKAYADLRAETARSYLGFFWWIIEPLLYLVVFYFAFGILLKIGRPGYVEFLLVGLVTWRWFDNTIRRGENAVLGSVGLMQQVYLPKYVFPFVAVLSNTVRFSVVLLLLLLYLMLLGPGLMTSWIALPVTLFVQLLWICAATLLVAAVVPFMPDMRIIIDNGLTLLLFLSGIFFDLSQMPETWIAALKINPMLVLIDSHRAVLLEGHWPDWSDLSMTAGSAIVVMIIALGLLRRYDLHYAKQTES